MFNLSSLYKKILTRRSTRQRPIARRQRRLALENLEDRTVPTAVNAYTVGSLTAAPGVTLNNVPVATFTDPSGAGPTSQYSAIIRWGDGTFSTGSISENTNTQVYSVTGSHTYAVGSSGSDQISVAITRDTGVAAVVDDETGFITTFGTDTNSSPSSVLGNTFPFFEGGQSGEGTGDLAFGTDGTTLFASNFTNYMYTLDVSDPTNPALVGQGGFSSVSNLAEGLAVTADGQYLLAAGGSGGSDQYLVMLNAQGLPAFQVCKIQVGTDEDSVATSADGSILVTSFNDQTVRRLTIDSGELTDTDQSLALGFLPTEVVAAPGGVAGVVVGTGGSIESFANDGLSEVSTATTTDVSLAVSAAFNATGTVLYVQDAEGSVDAFSFDPNTGAITGTLPGFTTITGEAQAGYFGIHSLAVSPDGSTLYVANYYGGSVDVFNAATGGTRIATITGSDIVNPTGIAMDVSQAAVTDSVMVSDAPVALNTPPLTFSANRGELSNMQPVATFTDPNGDLPVGSYSATIDWGDSNTTPGTISLSGSTFTVWGAHTYADSGSDSITVSVVRNSDPAAMGVTATAIVAELSVVLNSSPLSISGTVGSSIGNVVVATFTDPGGPELTAGQPTPGAYSATIDWGDGSTSTGTITYNNGTFFVTGSHTYTEASPTGGWPVSTTVDNGTSSLGLANDSNTGDALVFDPTTGTVLGSVNLPGGAFGAQTSIISDGTLGFAVNFSNNLFVLDLSNPASPTIASTIPISDSGEDLSVTPDGKYVIIAGADSSTISVVSVASRTQVSTFNLGTGALSVDASVPGIVLVATDSSVTELDIDGSGNLTAPGTTLNLAAEPNKIVVAPGGASGVVISRSGTLTSLTVPALTAVSSVTLEDFNGDSIAFNPTGTILYARSSTINGTGSTGEVQAYSFNPMTGAVSSSPLFSISVASTALYYGVNQLASSADGSTLYVPDDNNASIDLYNSTTGVSEGSITDPGIISSPTGIYVGAIPQTTTVTTAQATISDPAVAGTGGFTVTALRGESSGLQEVATFTDPGDPSGLQNNTDYTATINWGDSTGPDTSSAVIVPLGGNSYEVEASHTYTATGNFSIAVTLNHVNGPTITVYSTADVADPAVVLNTSPVPVTTVFGTGLDGSGNLLVAGSADPHFTVTDTTTFTPLGQATVVSNPPSLGWMGDTNTSQWISTTASGTPGSTDTYDYQTSFDLTGYNLATTVLDLDVAADDSLGDVLLNGVDTGISGASFDSLSSYSINSGFVSGLNTLDFIVPNSGSGPSGLQVQLSGTANPGSPFAFAATRGASSAVQTVATFTDLGNTAGHVEPVTYYQALINWGDGTAPTTGTITYSGGVYTVTGKHTYSEDNPSPISVTITDGTANTGPTQTSTPTVTDPSVLATGGLTLPVTAGQSLPSGTVVATFTDPGGAELTGGIPTSGFYSATISLGDGGPTVPGTISYNAAGGDFVVTTSAASQIYAEGSAPTVSVTIHAGNSTPVTVNDMVTVSDSTIAGTGGFTVDALRGESSGLQEVAIFTDPGDPTGLQNNTDYTATINWGDSTGPDTTSAVIMSLGGNSYEVEASHTYTASGDFSIAVSMKHVGGPTTTVNSTATVSDPMVVLNTTPVALPGLFATGVDGSGNPLVANDPDPHYALVSSADPNEPGPTARIVINPTSFGWVGSTGSSTWIAPDANGGVDGVLGNYDYQTTFTVPSGLSPSTVTLGGFVAADDNVEIFVNGTDTGVGFTGASSSLNPFTLSSSNTAFTSALHTGVNDLDFVVTNLGGVTGLQVQVSGTASAGFPATRGRPSPVQTVATFTDPGNTVGHVEPVTYYQAVINWGDGTAPTTGTITSNGGIYTVTGSHTYSVDNPSPISVTITDGTASTGPTQTSTPTVTDPSVLAAGGKTFNVMAGQSLPTGTVVATFTDPGGAELTGGSPTPGFYSAAINLGDGGPTVPGTISYNAAGNDFVVTTSAASEIYAEGSTPMVSVTIHAGSSTPVTVNDTVTVSDPAVVGTGGFTVTALRGESSGLQEVATFTDPGDPTGLQNNTDYTATINWGDSTGPDTSSAVIVPLGGNSYEVEASHTYTATGNFSIAVTLNHVNGPTITVYSTADVSNPAVVVSPAPSSFAAVRGKLSALQTVATFTDPGGALPVGDYSATISWGDGSTSPGTITYAAGIFTVLGSHTYSLDNPAPISVTITDGTASTGPTQTSTPTVTDPSVLASGGQTFNVTAGQSLPTGTVVATFTDPGGAELTGGIPTSGFYSTDINFGDGNGIHVGTGTVTYNAAGGDFVVTSTFASAAYAEGSTPNVTVTIHAGNSTPVTVNDTVTVSDPAVVGTGGFTVTALRGESSGLQEVATFTDPGDPTGLQNNTDYKATIHWGDATGSDATSAVIVSLGGNSYEVEAQHTYTESGDFGLSVTLQHAGAPSITVDSAATVTDPTVVMNTIPAPLTTAFGSGLDATGNLLPGGSSDPHFTITDTTTNTSLGQAIVVANPAANSWMGDTGTSQWISTDSLGDSSDDTFDYQTTFNLTGLNPSTTQLNLNVAADDQVTEILLNGVSTGIAMPGVGSGPWGFFTSATIASGFVAGVNTLDFIVPNTAGGGGGLQVQLNGTSTTGSPLSFTAKEGAHSAAQTLATFTDPGNTAGHVEPVTYYQALINWGDGTAPTTGTITYRSGVYTVTGSHTFAQAGSSPISVTIADGTAVTGPTQTGVAAIAEVPVVLNASPLTITAAENVSTGSVAVATFTDPGGPELTGGQPTPGDYNASVNWGDGTAADTSTTITWNAATQTFTVFASHTYSQAGIFPVAVSVTHGTTQTATATAITSSSTVSVPSVVASGGFDLASTEKVSTGTITVATFTDPAGPVLTGGVPTPGAYTATVIWGDGTTNSGIITYDGSGVFSVQSQHTYQHLSTPTYTTDGGTVYQITVLISHPDSTPQTVTDSMVVNPNIKLSGNASIPEGPTAYVLKVTPAKEAGTYTIHWGDGTPDTVILRKTGGGAAFGIRHVFYDTGVHTVSVDFTLYAPGKVGNGQLFTNVVSKPTDVTIHPPQDVTVSLDATNSGLIFTGTGTSSPANVAGGLTFTWSWTGPNTGAGQSVVVTPSNRTGETFSVGQPPKGTYKLTLTVTTVLEDESTTVSFILTAPFLKPGHKIVL